MKRVFKISIILLGLLIICFIILANITISVPKLKDTVVSRMTRALGREVTLQNLRINLFRGVELDGIVIANSKDFAEEAFFQARKVLMGYRLWPLVRRKLVIKKLVLVEPRILLERNVRGLWNFSDLLNPTSNPKASSSFFVSGAEAATKSQPVNKRFSFSISSVRIENGALTFKDASDSPIRQVDSQMDLDLNMSMREGGQFTSSGKIALSDLILYWAAALRLPMRVESLNADYRFDEWVLRVESLVAKTYQGSIEAGAIVDLTQLDLPRYKGFVKISGLEVNELLTATTAMKDMLYGTLDADIIEASGVGFTMQAMKANTSGKGFIKVVQGRISGQALQNKLATFFEGFHLRDIYYDCVTGHFTLTSGAIATDDLKLEGNKASIDVQGTIYLDCRMDLDVTCRFSPELVVGLDIPSFLLNEEGNAVVELEVIGTCKAPRPRLKTSRMIKRAEEKFKEEVGEKVSEEIWKVEKRVKEKIKEEFEGLLKDVFE